MSDGKVTSGTLKRQEVEKQRAVELEELKKERILKAFKNKAEQQILGEYKRIVIDSIQDMCIHNYGFDIDGNNVFQNFDMQALLDRIEFGVNYGKHGEITPYHKIELGSTKNIFSLEMFERFNVMSTDARDQLNKYNRNIVNATGANKLNITDSDLRDGFELNNEQIIKSLIDGQFRPADNAERFSFNNRILKTMGYSPIEKTIEQANMQVNNIWESVSKRAIANALKKFGINNL